MTASSSANSSPRRRWLRASITLLILGLTGWFMSGQIHRAWHELQTREFSISPAWIALTILCYAAGLTLMGTPWFLILKERSRAAGNELPVSWFQIVRIHVMSQVGKYVPGKAVVPVIRYGMLRGLGATIGLILLTTIFETFSTLSAGAWIGTIVLSSPLVPPLPKTLAWISPIGLLLALAFTTIILPPVFVSAPKIFARLRRACTSANVKPLHWSLVASSLFMSSLTWILIGLSFYATVQAVSTKTIPPSQIIPIAGLFVFSYIVGFVSMVPGHLGAREFVLDIVLVQWIGDEFVAVAATLLSRLVTLLVELTLAGVIFLTLRTQNDNLSITHRVAPDTIPNHGNVAS